MFFLIDKPLGITSYDVIRQLKKILNTKRIGHAGTLDPLATGCLLIATDKSTKLLHLLDGSRKRYRFTVRIDGTTPSYDLGTPITAFQKSAYREHTGTSLTEFLLAQTEQVPPIYSALHVDGKRSYELARTGSDHTLPSRPIQVEDVEIVSLDLPTIQIELTISSGGYIRSFAPLIGEFFGTPGGYITELRRIEIFTPYSTLNEGISRELEGFTGEYPLLLGEIFPRIPIVPIDVSILTAIQQGKILISLSDIHPEIGEKYFLSYRDEYLSLVEYTDEGYRIIRNDI